MIMISGTWVFYFSYNWQNGLYMDFKTYAVYAAASWIILVFFAFLIYMGFVAPISNMVQVLLEEYRYKDLEEEPVVKIGSESSKKLTGGTEELDEEENDDQDIDEKLKSNRSE
jgi:hypothetical protein